jgi:adenylate kinase
MNAPLKEYYDKKGLLATVINGEQAPEKVFADIDAILSKD